MQGIRLLGRGEFEENFSEPLIGRVGSDIGRFYFRLFFHHEVHEEELVTGAWRKTPETWTELENWFFKENGYGG